LTVCHHNKILLQDKDGNPFLIIKKCILALAAYLTGHGHKIQLEDRVHTQTELAGTGAVNAQPEQHT
jgi:hypothetical protein